METRRIAAVLAAVLAAGLCACSTYRPAEAPAGLTWSQAQILLARDAAAADWAMSGSGVAVGETAFTVDGYECRYADTPQVELSRNDLAGASAYSTLELAGCRYAKTGEAMNKALGIGWHSDATGRDFASAWWTLAHTAVPDPAADPAFQQVVRDYRANGNPAEFPEDARPARVAAEQAVKDKRFDAAQRAYEDALKRAPWWPAGHFNRALVLAEMGVFGEATLEMKRYLQLEPDAENKRQVQDKIYAWQSKTPW